MLKVLIVDDAQFMRETIKSMLKEANITEVEEAADGIEGIEKYKSFAPDIVLMDITMPELNGIESLKGIRQYDPKAKVIIVSAMGQEAKIKEAIMNGALHFIVKPFQSKDLINTILKIAQK